MPTPIKPENELEVFMNKVAEGQKILSERPRTRSNSEQSYPEPAEEISASYGGSGSSKEASSRRWASDDTKFWACKTTYDTLPSGLYKPMFSNNIGFFLEKQIIDTDDLIALPNTASEEVLDEIKKFWTLKELFYKGGFIHKRGILLWGDPGSGKTATIQLLLKSIVEDYNGIALFANHPEITSNCLQMIRRIEPKRPMIVIFEDFDAMTQEHGEAGYLALLDGESQVSNVVFVATTNYPERLDKRFIDRPSRFDTIKLIPMPSAEARKLYLNSKEPSLKNKELDEWVKLSEGFSVAHLKEMIISNRYYGHDIKKIASRLKIMNKRKFLSENAIEGNSDVGFIGSASYGEEEQAA